MHKNPPKRRRDGSWEVVNEDGTRSIVWGVASTGQKAKEGTAELVDHADGSRDAIVRPEPASLGVRSGDFVREEIHLDLTQLEQQIMQAVRTGQLKTRPNPNGKGRIVDPRDFQAWVAGL